MIPGDCQKQESVGFSIKLSYYSCCFSAGNTELIIKEGPTSALMSLEVIGHPANQLQSLRYREHVAPVTSGFHVSLRGTFGPSSHLAIAYAAFSYMGKCVLDDDKTRGSCLIPMPSIYTFCSFLIGLNVADCFAGTDFLCQNHKCIPSQLNCDGFDHCGDNSDEPATCSQSTYALE